MYVYYNPNPTGKNVGDCTVRAISKALYQDWESTYTGLVLYGYMLGDMPSANTVWGAFLRSKGYQRYIIPDSFPDLYTVSDFAAEHEIGTYILALSGHVVCIQNGDIYDSWDSSREIPLYYWYKE